MLSLVIGLIATFPVLRAVRAGEVHGSTLAAQAGFSAVVLGISLMTAGRRP